MFYFRLENIHNNNFIHRDIHSGNMLFVKENDPTYQWQIGDLGLSQPANNTLSNDEIYGVIPYIAPEIFNGAKFSKESDIYNLGMIMWEFTTGCKPFLMSNMIINLFMTLLMESDPKLQWTLLNVMLI